MIYGGRDINALKLKGNRLNLSVYSLHLGFTRQLGARLVVYRVVSCRLCCKLLIRSSRKGGV